MEQMTVLDQMAPAGEAGIALAGADYALSVAIVYRDALTRKWAEEVCARVTRSTSSEGIHTRSWRLGELSRSRNFRGAVQTAAAADVIIVSVYASDQLPLDFYSWVNEWLTERRRAPSALVALIGMPDFPDFRTSPIQEYLEAVAQEGHLDFLTDRKRLNPDFIDLMEQDRRDEEQSFSNYGS
jgi:hypothetical protein